MKLDNNLFEQKFDDIDGKVDVLIEACQRLQKENSGLKDKITDLETRLQTSEKKGDIFSQQKAGIQSKIDGLFDKLDEFTKTHPL